MDALSEVLKTVKLDSAFFFNAEFSAPWSFRSPASCKLAPYINHSGGHVIVFHLLIEGRAYVQLGDERLAIVPGDVVIFPHGDSTPSRAVLALTRWTVRANCSGSFLRG